MKKLFELIVGGFTLLSTFGRVWVRESVCQPRYLGS